LRRSAVMLTAARGRPASAVQSRPWPPSFQQANFPPRSGFCAEHSDVDRGPRKAGVGGSIPSLATIILPTQCSSGTYVLARSPSPNFRAALARDPDVTPHRHRSAFPVELPLALRARICQDHVQTAGFDQLGQHDGLPLPCPGAPELMSIASEDRECATLRSPGPGSMPPDLRPAPA